MKRIISTVTIVTLVSGLFFLSMTSGAQTGREPNQTAGAEPNLTVRRSKPRVDSVTMADFYMRDGNAVSGKLLSDDKNQIIIEQAVESKIVTAAYSKREVDTRTISTRSVPEPTYYSQLAEYFAARTWDFRDDPDEFIEAIRCYEKAKQSLLAANQPPEKLAEIDKALKKVQDDRDVWTRETESRAKLRKLEFEAEAENRLKQVEKQVAENAAKVGENIKYLEKTAADIKGDYDKLENIVTGMNKDFVQQIRILQTQTTNNQAAINDIYYNCCFLPRSGPR
jgi:hypothetical protein